MATNLARTNNGGSVMTAIATPPVTPIPTAVGQSMGNQIMAQMWAVDFCVKRPTGRVGVTNSDVQARNDAGEQEKIDSNKITKPSFKIDQKSDHPAWELLDLNARKFDSILTRYSVNDARRGFHIVPQCKVGEMGVEMSAARAERLTLAEGFRDTWSILINNLRTKFNGHFHLLFPKLPNPESLLEKFDVTWIITPMTPIDPAHFNLQNVNEADRAKLIEESTNMTKSLIAQQAKGIYDQVFGTVLAQCDEIAAGSFESGTRKFGSITELVEIIDRLRNFGELGNAEILAHASATRDLLAGITDISDINTNSGQNQVTAAIKAASKPLATAIKTMLEARKGASRARRHMEG